MKLLLLAALVALDHNADCRHFDQEAQHWIASPPILYHGSMSWPMKQEGSLWVARFPWSAYSVSVRLTATWDGKALTLESDTGCRWKSE